MVYMLTLCYLPLCTLMLSKSSLFIYNTMLSDENSTPILRKLYLISFYKLKVLS